MPHTHKMRVHVECRGYLVCACVSSHVAEGRVGMQLFSSKKDLVGWKRKRRGPAHTHICWWSSGLRQQPWSDEGCFCRYTLFVFGFPFAFYTLLFPAQEGWRSGCWQLTPHLLPGGQTGGVLWRHSAGGGQ